MFPSVIGWCLFPLAACRRLRVRRVSHEAQTGGTPRDVEAALCPAGRADGEPVVGRFAPFEQHERVSKTDPLAAFEN
jgi:hypothetical protein